MAKIGIDIRLIGKKRTGDEAVIFNLVKNLAQLESKHEFRLFTDVTDGDILKDIEKQLGIMESRNFKIISLKTPNRFAWNFWTLPQYLKKNPVDVYHTQYITPFFVSKKIKILTIVHDISFNFFPQFIKFADLFFLKTLIPMSLRRADLIVGVSQFTKDEIVKYYGTDSSKVEWIHNSIGDEFLQKEISNEKLEAVRKKYALPEKFILYVGTLQPRKNIPRLIEAFAKTKDKLAGAKLVICGNRQAHNFDQRIDEAVKRHDLSQDVVFPGFVEEEDKVAIYHLAQVFAFPSLYEGFGIPVLEAMSQGIPVLASDIPSLKEVAEKSALYFDPSNLDEFSKMMYDISMDNNLRNGLIQAGNARVSQFSWKNSALKILALYEKLSDKKSN